MNALQNIFAGLNNSSILYTRLRENLSHSNLPLDIFLNDDLQNKA